MSKHDAYFTRTRLQLDEIDRQLSLLTDQARTGDDEAAQALKQRLAALTADARAAGVQLDVVRAADEKGWHALVSEMERQRHGLSDALATYRVPG